MRIVAATHQDLEAMIRDGRFRPTCIIGSTSSASARLLLRECREDIFELALHFLRVHAVGVGKETTQIDDEAIEALTGG